MHWRESREKGGGIYFFISGSQELPPSSPFTIMRICTCEKMRRIDPKSMGTECKFVKSKQRKKTGISAICRPTSGGLPAESNWQSEQGQLLPTATNTATISTTASISGTLSQFRGRVLHRHFVAKAAPA